jgi:urocanate hydratase
LCESAVRSTGCITPTHSNAGEDCGDGLRASRLILRPAQSGNGAGEDLAPEAQSAGPLEFVVQVERAYEALAAAGAADAATGLGGKLLYAGELDADGRALVVAANIAGAASLAATADHNAQKQALRDGVADFPVNSLDEALRILKNQLRKREPVAVCVGLEPEAIENEMRERGVQPDLLRDDATRGGTDADDQRTKWITWTVDSGAALWLPKIDAIAIDCLPEEARWARRWLRLAPRYLGRLADGFRVLHCGEADATTIADRISNAGQSGEIGVAVALVASMRAESLRSWQLRQASRSPAAG